MITVPCKAVLARAPVPTAVARTSCTCKWRELVVELRRSLDIRGSTEEEEDDGRPGMAGLKPPSMATATSACDEPRRDQEARAWICNSVSEKRWAPTTLGVREPFTPQQEDYLVRTVSSSTLRSSR